MKKLGTYDIPEYALCYLAYGESDNLTESEIETIKNFVKEHFPKGYYLDIHWDDYNEFDRYPAFGERNPNALTSKGEPPYLACKTYKVTFYV